MRSIGIIDLRKFGPQSYEDAWLKSQNIDNKDAIRNCGKARRWTLDTGRWPLDLDARRCARKEQVLGKKQKRRPVWDAVVLFLFSG